MTKDSYFEMCEMLNTDPIDSEIPVDYEDFPIEIQEVFQVYSLLQDNWDYVNGAYIGKSLYGIRDILDICGISDSQALFFIQTIALLDSFRREEYAIQRKASAPKS